MSDDFFVATGEFYDLPSQEYWRSLRAPVAEALRRARPEQGPILDVGAGTGLGAIMVAETVPAAETLSSGPFGTAFSMRTAPSSVSCWRSTAGMCCPRGACATN